MNDQENKTGVDKNINAAELAKLTGIPIDEIKREHNIPCYRDAEKEFFKCQRGSNERENALIRMIELAENIGEIVHAHNWADSDFSSNHNHLSAEKFQQAKRGDDGKMLRLALRKWAELTSKISQIKSLLRRASFIPIGKRQPVNIIEYEVRVELYEKWLKLVEVKEELSDLYEKTWHLAKYKDLNTRILIKGLKFTDSIQKLKQEKLHYKSAENNSINFDADLVIKAIEDRLNEVSLEKAETANDPKEYRKIYCEVFDNPTAQAIIRNKWDEFSLSKANVATSPADYKEVCDSAHGDSEAVKIVLAKWRPPCLAAINSAETIEEADKASRWITSYDSEVKKIYLDKCNELSLKEYNSATTKEDYAAAYRRAYDGSEAKKLALKKLTELCGL